jgi:hypothetical protein
MYSVYLQYIFSPAVVNPKGWFYTSMAESSVCFSLLLSLYWPDFSIVFAC